MKPFPSALLTKLAILFATLLLMVAALEFGARLALGPRFVRGSFAGIPQDAVGEFHPDYGWVNKAGASTRIIGSGFAYNARINSKGLRDREHPYEPPAGVTRIALLGDSVAWGWGVDEGFSLGDLLEQELQPRAEVINLAVPGYSTDQQLWTLADEGRRYAPDLVLLCYILNDLTGNLGVEMSGLGKPRYERDAAGEWVVVNRPVADPGRTRGEGPRPPFLERLHSRSGLLQLLRPFSAEDALETGAPLPDFDPEVRARHLEQHMARVDLKLDDLADRSSVHVMLLRRMRSLCDELGAPLVVMSVPHHHDHFLYDPAVPLPAELASPQAQPFHTRLSRILMELGDEIGFPVISVDQTMLEAVRRGESLRVSDGHLNERGNALVAAEVARALRPLLEDLRR